jgi:hypothetical protein
VKMCSDAESISQLEALDSALPATEGARRLWPFLRNRESVFALACCAIVLVCVLVARPFANAGFDDDWSYSHVALRFAETGTVHYNGWGSPTLLFQTVWGALWIRLFGFSFNLLRLATLPFSLGFVWLVYALGRRIGLRRDLAGFGALAVGTSPLFIPLAASFMTEPYACFFTTLCIYAAIRTAEARPPSSALWLWALAVSGVVGGSDRQTVWIAPIALIPYLFWIKRRDRRFAIHVVATYAFCIASIAILLAKFTTPYAPLEVPRRELIQLVIDNSFVAFVCVISALLTWSLVSLPAFLCLVPLWKRLDGLRLILSGVACAAVVALLGGFGGLGIVPFVGNMLTPSGILKPGEAALGFKPEVLPLFLRAGLTCMLAFAVASFGQLCWRLRTSAVRVPLTLFAVFSGAYLPCFFPGALLGLTYDRYVLPLFPLLVISILVLFQSHIRTVPVTAWVCLLVFAGYGIATTHDYFASLRARTSVAESLQRRGIARDRISAGFEYDGWTQVQQTGNIRAPRYGDHPRWNSTDTFFFWSYTNAVRPEYIVINSQAITTSASGFPIVPFNSWMPPFRRAVVVSRRSDLVKVK